MRLFRLFRWLVTVVTAAVLTASQVGPGEAVSNLAKWAELVSIQLPPLLTVKAADHWVALGCTIFLVAALVSWVIEYRLSHTHIDYDILPRPQVITNNNKAAYPRVNARHDAIKLLIGEQPPFEEIQQFVAPGAQRRRTIKIGIRNDGNGFVSNCTLHMFGIFENWDKEREISLQMADGVTLQPGETRYFDVAAYDEEFRSGESGKFVIFSMRPAGNYMISNPHMIVREGTQDGPWMPIRFEAKSTDASDSILQCRIGLQHNGSPRLRLLKA